MPQSSYQRTQRLSKCRRWRKDKGWLNNIILPINIPILTTRAKVLASAKGESEKIKLIGAAEARAVEAVGRLECLLISSDCLFYLLQSRGRANAPESCCIFTVWRCCRYVSRARGFTTGWLPHMWECHVCCLTLDCCGSSRSIG